VALDFDPKNVNMRVVKGALEKLFETKHAKDNTDRFNLVLFRGNPAYLEDFTFKKDYLLSLVKEDVEDINTVPVESVIFMALTFLIEVYKKVGNKFFRIIIFTDQDMKPVTKEFIVQNLLDITKEMPVYVDIIRLNVKDGTKDDSDAKLRQLISWSKGGELIYVPKLKKLDEIIPELAEKKWNDQEDIFEEIKEIKIPEAYADFYENLSMDPAVIENPGETKCMACFQQTQDNNMLFKCPSCDNAIMHEVCWAHWSKTSNIGVRHIFRCPICFTMLKLPRPFVDEVLGPIEEEEAAPEVAQVTQEVAQNVQVADQNELLKEKDQKAEPKLIEQLLDSII
jgi:hypothetical protein